MKPKPETFEQAFVKLNAEVTEAFNSGDVRRCARFYSADATLLLSDRPPVRGRAAIEAALQGFASVGAKLKPVEILEIRSSGDMGVCAGTYVFEVPRAGGAPAEQRGKFVTVFMRQPDGSWNAVIDSLLGDAT
jgi:ketosteroid isomerase-like protein